VTRGKGRHTGDISDEEASEPSPNSTSVSISIWHSPNRVPDLDSELPVAVIVWMLNVGLRVHASQLGTAASQSSKTSSCSSKVPPFQRWLAAQTDSPLIGHTASVRLDCIAAGADYRFTHAKCFSWGKEAPAGDGQWYWEKLLKAVIVVQCIRLSTRV
jgi:hypothetical protein